MTVRKGTKTWRSQIHVVKKAPPRRTLTQEERNDFAELFESNIDEGYKPGDVNEKTTTRSKGS